MKKTLHDIGAQIQFESKSMVVQEVVYSLLLRKDYGYVGPFKK